MEEGASLTVESCYNFIRIFFVDCDTEQDLFYYAARIPHYLLPYLGMSTKVIWSLQFLRLRILEFLAALAKVSLSSEFHICYSTNHVLSSFSCAV